MSKTSPYHPPFRCRHPSYYDLLDWLGAFFGFQDANVSNQREHIVLHLANAQLQLPPATQLHRSVIRDFRRELLSNYTQWCSFLGHESNIRTCHPRRRELLYVALYLLIWGESANLRFMPECICYIFHHMAMELNKILEDGRPTVSPSTSGGKNAFLDSVVTPIYDMLKAEVLENGRKGTAPYSHWRNYDDINEYFWSRSCFDGLKWPIDVTSNFFMTKRVHNKMHGEKMGRGFVEQRSFWNLFTSFDRLWIMLILFLQAAIIVACEEEKAADKHIIIIIIHVRLLTVFITWSVLRFVKSLVDAGMQFCFRGYKLVSKETLWLGVRMLSLKVVWIIVFVVFYARIWDQKNHEATIRRKVVDFHMVALVFIIPELLAVALFFVPNFVENNIPRIFYNRVTRWWWFESRCFVGRGVREGVVDKIKYSLFWLVVLLTKFCFSYLMQIKPMIQTTKDLLVADHDTKFNPNAIDNKFVVGIIWVPVVLIYLMDLQIWYCIYSSIVGWGVGMFIHLGEIQNMQQLKLRFQYVAWAIQFNLMSQQQEQSLPLKKLESNQVEARKFASIWNEIILTFREEDIVSDHEVELLEVPENTWNVRVVRWPCLLLCNELHLAISKAKHLSSSDHAASDQWLWYKMTKNHEYRRCAIIEVYDSVNTLLLAIINSNRPEYSIFKTLFQEIDNSIDTGNFTRTFNMLTLAKIHTELITLVHLSIKPKKDVKKMVHSLQALYELVIKGLFRVRRNIDQLIEDGLAPRMPLPGGSMLFENAVELPNSSNDVFYRQARRLHAILTSRDALDTVPVNREARRRIVFFSNSLFMKMPPSPQIKKMMAFSVLTPYDNEEVLYGGEEIKADNEDGVSILYYLQTLYADEWQNFLERMRRDGIASEDELRTTQDGRMEIRLWASYRGQTLSRTVRGMMYYYKALEMLARLDFESEIGGVDGRSKETIIPMMKYTYVVACYKYGIQKARNHYCADEILWLMEEHEALRVAYVDEVQGRNGAKEYYSVLVKYDQDREEEVEIYRVKLPGPLEVGEGKSENQNHAIIFTRGDALQTIDTYQDNYFEEALKLRNLLEEFRCYYGARKPTMLGVRENIFTNSVSSLASFMSAQETSFVTLGQRVLANPLKIRLHYGHPDVFHRFWFLTRGGLSKASRVINSSQSIFGGFNCTLRGGNITHHEYIQVGKGRDFGFNQVSMFEAIVASGNGEQALSRDVYRLGHRLEFFRMLSFYYTTVGFFFNSVMISWTVFVFSWVRLYMALSDIESYDVAVIANANRAVGTILNQQFFVQLGLLTALPMLLESYLELGILAAIWDFITMQLQLLSVFFTFSMGIHAHHFGGTILHGVTNFRARERGFVVQHKTFADNYRHYASSHFIKAIELGLILIVCGWYSPSGSYMALTTISSWFLVFSWIMAPFIFNPSGFDWLKTVSDYEDFMKWIWREPGMFVKSERSWEIWWYHEKNHLRTARFLRKLLGILLNLRFFYFQYGVVYKLGIAANRKSLAVYLLSWIYVVVVVGFFFIIAYARKKYATRRHIYYRLVQCLFIISGLVIIVVLKVTTQLKFLDLLTSQLAFLPTGWGLLWYAQRVCTPWENTVFSNTVIYAARVYEIMLGMIILAPVAILSWMPGFHSMQTRTLFNDAFSKGLWKFQLIAGKKQSKLRL